LHGATGSLAKFGCSAQLTINGMILSQPYAYLSGTGTMREHFGIPTLGGSSPAMTVVTGAGDYEFAQYQKWSYG
jgi:hypothetical protein